MFKLAVLGPVVTSGFGVARQCLECNRRQPRGHPPQCYGIGAGCLGYAPITAAVDASDHEVRLSAKRLL